MLLVTGHCETYTDVREGGGKGVGTRPLPLRDASGQEKIRIRRSNVEGPGTRPRGNQYETADALRANMDAAEYKHVVLGLIFLKYISDAFRGAVPQPRLQAKRSQGADPEDPVEYQALDVLYGYRG
ncbi:type I restriction-modification system subunit M N-terminal domain-containing protein [Thermogemmata fonticola]|uniref:Type I restriction-modification system subunit M N-terminal domain-containing protein n=1 Tax=Thermogemmata fonticola TaxID=2755323 RepID=A0A7V8VBC8_9BACT|nr:type I restriction-modification system subunit M N-terminal domain-containing protein [Thermogemmata fonticola]MBA2224695.1 type I restriction-modification system subunit M N-terminal domain-containing protein [Thermogemmata fonticola]